MTETSKTQGKEDPPPTLLVWAVRIVSLGLLLGIIGFLFYMIASDTRPAKFEITADYAQMRQQGSDYVLPIKVLNDSTEAVTAVVLEATLSPPGGDKIDASTTIMLMGEGEAAALEMVFENRPSPDTLDLRVSSYQSP